MLVYRVQDDHVLIPLQFCIRKGKLLYVPPGLLGPDYSPRFSQQPQRRYIEQRYRTSRILQLKASGLKTALIAERLGLTVRTVRRDLAINRQFQQRFRSYWETTLGVEGCRKFQQLVLSTCPPLSTCPDGGQS